MSCTNFNFPEPETHQKYNKESHLAVSELVLKEFGYPARAKYLVESIESQYKDGFNCYVEYIISFAVRKMYWSEEEVITKVGSEEFKFKIFVRKFHKAIRERRFRSQKNLLFD